MSHQWELKQTTPDRDVWQIEVDLSSDEVRTPWLPMPNYSIASAQMTANDTAISTGEIQLQRTNTVAVPVGDDLPVVQTLSSSVLMTDTFDVDGFFYLRGKVSATQTGTVTVHLCLVRRIA